MQNATFNFMTKAQTCDRSIALEQIWDLDHWLSKLDRVKKIKIRSNSNDEQLFELHFDAGRDQPDVVLVRRTSTENRITVDHLIPPPGIVSLSAAWWVTADGPPTVYAHRKITMKEGQATPDTLRNIQSILNSNLAALIAPGQQQQEIA
ncbi:hypothetical protein LCGC14_0565390 [marine sediment metagenome]|uniref:Uncharacterized protein n=1 Tax=marine sediment metagenome TaxID=412755 RepID=A0A0F9S4C9_9ZZZZ